MSDDNATAVDEKKKGRGRPSKGGSGDSNKVCFLCY